MKRIILAALIVSFPITCLAAPTGILGEVRQGKTIAILSDEVMHEARGAALIYGQPLPSNTPGKTTHMVTYKGWGSTSDYVSFNYIGNYSSMGVIPVPYNGYLLAGVGDEWKADYVSNPGSWSASNASTKETHYQLLYSDGSLSPYAVRETGWNRPINKFFW